MNKSFKSTKNFYGYPCTHRQWKADSHCKYVHGYSRSFHFVFECSELSKEIWVMDFGDLKEVKTWLDYMFDHTFLVSSDDPFIETFKDLDKKGVIQMRELPNAGMEGSAVFVFDHVNEMVKKKTNNRVWLYSVEVKENEKNSAIYSPRN